MKINKTVLLLVGLPIAALYWVQNTPGMEEKISRTFSSKEMLEVKYKDPEKQEQYEKNKAPMFDTGRNTKSAN